MKRRLGSAAWQKFDWLTELPNERKPPKPKIASALSSGVGLPRGMVCESAEGEAQVTVKSISGLLRLLSFHCFSLSPLSSRRQVLD